MTPQDSDDRSVARTGDGPGLGSEPLPAHLVSAVEDAFSRLRAGDVQMIGLPVPSMPGVGEDRYSG